jgi:hypothetical protein
MGVNAGELEKLRADYQRVKGAECPDYYCPILNEFGQGPRGLVDGHIVPECIQFADRTTVIQRADVDNDFGKIEAVLCNFLNRPFYDIQGLYKRLTSLTITGSSGTPAQAFFSSKKAAPPFPQIVLTDKNGEPIAAPFAKVPADQMNEFEGPVEIEGEIIFSIPALIVSLVKSAHLALFKLLGYRWVLHESGQYISTRLGRVVRNRVDAESVRQLADELPRKCFRMKPGKAFDVDTMSSRVLMFHYDYYDGKGHPCESGLDAWGVSCLLTFNGCSFTITLPFTFLPNGLEAAFNRYRHYLTEPAAKHSVYTGQLESDGVLSHAKIGHTLTYGDEDAAAGA